MHVFICLPLINPCDLLYKYIIERGNWQQKMKTDNIKSKLDVIKRFDHDDSKVKRE